MSLLSYPPSPKIIPKKIRIRGVFYADFDENDNRIDKEDMYLQCLEHYGQREVISMLSSINPIGYFKYYKKVGTGVINNKEFTHYAIFKGSSEFDTKEMAIFLDGIIQECENVGIPTLTKNEIERLKLWKKEF